MRLLIAVALVALLALPALAETLTASDDLNVVDDATVGGNLATSGNASIGGNISTTGSASISGQVSAATFSIPTIKQWMPFEFDESLHSGKAYPDTMVNVEKRPVFIAPVAGSIVGVITLIHGDGDAAWDSLTVDVLAGVGADTSCLSTLPKLTAAQGDRACSEDGDGRAAVTNPSTRDVAAGELVELSARCYGTVTGPPVGLKVWVIFAPDH